MKMSPLVSRSGIAAWMLMLSLTVSTSTWAASVWQPTNQDVNTLDFSLLISLLPTGNFYIFDDNSAASLQTSTNLKLASADLLMFSMNGANWDITGTNGTLTVTGSTSFLFAENVAGIFSQEASANMLGPNDWQLVFASGAQLQAIDVAPVPVPPALLLIGCGLLGLLSIARRHRNVF